MPLEQQRQQLQAPKRSVRFSAGTKKKVGLSLPAIIARLTKKALSAYIEGEGGVHFRSLSFCRPLSAFIVPEVSLPL